MPRDPLHDAVYLKIETTIEENYRGVDGSYPVAPHAVATLASLAALAAIEEEGKVIVDRADLDAYVNRDGVDLLREVDALNRLLAILEDTAPQPSGTLQDVETSGDGMRGHLGLPNGPTALSALRRAEEAEEALDVARQTIARVTAYALDQATYRPVEADSLAAVVLNLNPHDLRPGAALAALTPITEEKPCG